MSIWYDPLSYINIAELYLLNPYLIDALILLTIFLGLSQYVFTKKDSFGKRHGKTLAIAVSTALTISSSIFMYYQGWNLASPGVSIIPFTILFLILYYFLYTVLTDLIGMEKKCAGSLSFLITYPGVQALFGDPQNAITAQFPALGALFSLLIIVAVVVLLTCLAGFFPKKPGSENNDSTNAVNSPEKNKRKEKETKPGKPLSFSYEQPSGPYTTQDTIILQGTISGGSGKYQYVGVVEGTGQKIEGTKNPIQTEIENPGKEGEYKLKLVINDGQEQIAEIISFEITPKASDELTLTGQAVVMHQDQAHSAQGMILQLYTKRTEMESRPIRKDWAKVNVQNQEGDFVFKIPNEDAVYEIRAHDPEDESQEYIAEIALETRKYVRKPAVVIKKDTQPPRIFAILQKQSEQQELAVEWSEPSGEYSYGDEIPVQAKIVGGSGEYIWDGTEHHNVPDFSGTGDTIQATIPSPDPKVENPEIRIFVDDGHTSQVFTHPIRMKAHQDIQVQFANTEFEQAKNHTLQFEITGGSGHFLYQGTIANQEFKGKTKHKAKEKLSALPAGEHELKLIVVDKKTKQRQDVTQTITVAGKQEDKKPVITIVPVEGQGAPYQDRTRIRLADELQNNTLSFDVWSQEGSGTWYNHYIISMYYTLENNTSHYIKDFMAKQAGIQFIGNKAVSKNQESMSADRKQTDRSQVVGIPATMTKSSEFVLEAVTATKAAKTLGITFSNQQGIFSIIDAYENDPENAPEHQHKAVSFTVEVRAVTTQSKDTPSMEQPGATAAIDVYKPTQTDS